MDEIYTRIIDQGSVPSREDIANLLSSIGPSGEAREKKLEVVIQLMDELGHNGLNFQGIHITDTLESYEAY